MAPSSRDLKEMRLYLGSGKNRKRKADRLVFYPFLSTRSVKKRFLGSFLCLIELLSIFRSVKVYFALIKLEMEYFFTLLFF